jgi:Meckel syndrome type 1 protein
MHVTPAAAPVSGNPCGHCGAELKPAAKFCGKCGKTLAPAAADLPAAQTPPQAAAPLSPAVAQEEKPHVAQAGTSAAPATPTADRATSTSAETKPPLQKPTAPQSPSKQSTPGTKRSVPAAAIAAVAIVLAGALGVGGYFIFKPKASEQPIASTATPAHAEPAPAPAPAASAPQADPLPATPPVADNKPVTAAPAVTAPAAAAVPAKAANEPIAAGVKETSNKSKPSTNVSRKESDGNQSAGMAAAINASLDEGAQCMSKKKYDCAIGNANTVLRLDPGNARAQDMKRKAKEAQDHALSQIDIQ